MCIKTCEILKFHMSQSGSNLPTSQAPSLRASSTMETTRNKSNVTRLLAIKGHNLSREFTELFSYCFVSHVDNPGWRENFNTRDFNQMYEFGFGLHVATISFTCKHQPRLASP